MSEIKLHLGCGNNKIKGWVNIDKYKKVDIIDDMIILKRFKDKTISEIYTSHAIEHITPEDFIRALKRWYTLLKIGGTLVIRCPNAEYHLNRYLNISDEEKLNDMISLKKKGYLRGIFGYQNRGEGYKNRNLFTKGLLAKSIEYVGFKVEDCRECSLRTSKMVSYLKSGGRDLGLVVDDVPINDLWCKAIK